jgi:hypothetical protein
MIEMTIEEYQATISKKNKYGAKKTYCGQKHLHDSKKEARRCDELNVLKMGGMITRLKQQVKFILLRSFWIDHEKIRPICYLADFTYYEDGVLIIEDVKGKLTEVYKLKKKMLLNKIKNRKHCKFIET